MLLGAFLVLQSAWSGSAMSRQRWNQLFRSDASSFKSDEEFHEAHQLLRSNTKTIGSKHRQQMYTIELKDCNGACHKKLSDRFGKNKLRRAAKDVVQVSADPRTIKELAAGDLSKHIVDFAPLHPNLKYENILSSRIKACGKEGDKLKLIASVIPLAQPELDRLIQGLKHSLPAEVRDEKLVPGRSNLLSITTSCLDANNVLISLSEWPELDWIEELIEFETSNRWGASLTQSGETNRYPIFDANITGHGQIIGISDTGIDMESCYFKDANVPPPFDVVDYTHRKVIYYDTYVDAVDDRVLGHGSHVAGSVAGASTVTFGTFSEYNGNAPNAKISFFDIGNDNYALSLPTDLDENLLQVLYSTGAKIITNSWGSVPVDAIGRYNPGANSYSLNAKSVDSFMIRNPDALVFFSAGNYGDYFDGNTVVAPSTNKNGVCVGASLNDRDAWRSYVGPDAKSGYNSNGVAYFSSIGPTQDNRLKPDIVAPGWPVYSASASSSRTASCTVKALQGTSMASPTAAGVAALVREYFVEGYYPSGTKNSSDGFVPSGALLKAMLVHSGRKITRRVFSDSTAEPISQYPNTVQGYGRITIGDVLNFGPSEGEYLSLFVRGGATPSDKYYVSFNDINEEHVYVFKTNGAPSQHPIRITVAYTDPLPPNSATNAQVHSFSLQATNLNTSETFSPLAASGTSGNNVIMIDIPSPSPNSTFKVVMTATSIINPEQSYALVMSGEVTVAFIHRNATPSVDISSDAIGITRSMMSGIWILVSACLLLMVVIYAIHHENDYNEKKTELLTKKRKRASLLYKSG